MTYSMIETSALKGKAGPEPAHDQSHVTVLLVPYCISDIPD